MLKQIDGSLNDTVPTRRPITVRDLLTSTFGLGMDMTAIGTPIMDKVFDLGLTPIYRSRCPSRTSGCAASARFR